MREDPAWEPAGVVDVHRNGGHVSVAVLDHLMAEFRGRRHAHEWDDDRAVSDRWLAPRLHWALRLTRAEASDRGTWHWLAVRHADYVDWRWSGADGVAENRWHGPHHKQALARLWWGAEVFRNGADYQPVVRAFVRQDLPNSYLHRAFVRCRPLAHALLDVAAPAGRETEVSADEVNNLVRAVNLATAGSPPEMETGYPHDDVLAYLRWCQAPVSAPASWEDLPAGPPCTDVTDAALADARIIAERCHGYAERTTAVSGSRSARRTIRRGEAARAI